MSTPENNAPAPQHLPGPHKSPRQIYRETMARRQMRIFSIIIVFLLAALALAALTLTGIIPTPFGNEFSKKIDYAEMGDTPCPTEDARPVSVAGAQLQVLNASSVSGLAGSVAGTLEEMGYGIALVDNASDPFMGNVQLDVGPASVDLAYTIARYFEAPVRIKLRELPIGTVSITLGKGFQGLLPADDLTALATSTSRLQPLRECLPVDPKSVPETQQSGGQQSGPQSGSQSGEGAQSE